MQLRRLEARAAGALTRTGLPGPDPKGCASAGRAGDLAKRARPERTAQPRSLPRLRPIRDFVFDHTPFLQKVAGDSNPREIINQLALIED